MIPVVRSFCRLKPQDTSAPDLSKTLIVAPALHSRPRYFALCTSERLALMTVL